MTAFFALSVYLEGHGKDIQELIDQSVEQGDSFVADLAFDIEEALKLLAATAEIHDDSEDELEIE
jgi:hypothetical protein